MSELKDFEPWKVGVNASPKEQVSFSDTAAEIDLEKYRLSERIKSLILNSWSGNSGFKSRSEADEAVIVALLSKSATDDEIRAIFQSYVIGEKYREKGTAGDKYLAHSIARAKAYISEESETGGANGSSDGVAAEARESEFRNTDVGNGQRFVKQHGQNVRYSFEREHWLVWSGEKWQWDTTGEVSKLAKQTAVEIYAEAAAAADPDRRVALAKHAVRSESDGKLRAMLNQAKSEAGIPVTLGQLDAYPFLFNMQNGILDLKTGILMEHGREYLLTQISPVAFEPDARCDLFMGFLDRILNGRVALVDFCQRLFGHCLTGDVTEQIIALLIGQGSNGKSTLLQILLHVFGDYGCMAAPGLLMTKRIEQHPTEIADLCGRRLVCTVEVQEGKRFNEALFKWASGGDTLKARHMREDFFSFAPTHKLVIACNHKPLVSDTSDAFWRRLRTIPFDVTIPKEQQDKNLLDKLKAEGPGILAWLVRGCLKWRAEGLGEPEEVEAATQTYREEQDALKVFLTECCEVELDSEEQVGKVYAKFKEWADENGERIVSSKRFSGMLKQRGFGNYQATDGKYRWKGLRLKF